MTTNQFLSTSWNMVPAALTFCVLALVASLQGRSSSFRRKLWLAMAAALFAVAMFSPLSALARGYLFSAHMIQHLLLLLIIPALLCLSLPLQSAQHSSRNGNGPETDLSIKNLVISWLAGVGAMWLWHIPALCNAAATNDWVRHLQTVSLLVMGGIFWWPVLRPATSLRIAPLAGVVYLFTACMACTLLGIYITFSPIAVCSAYHHPVDRLGILPLLRQRWGLTPSVDQQLGGLLMWVPSCLIYLIGVMGQLARWYSNNEPAEAPFLPTPQTGGAGSS
jgi:putative membrane protein